MNRREFIRQLDDLLADWPNPQEREEKILQYQEMLADLSEKEACQKIDDMGGAQGVAQELRRKKGLSMAAPNRKTKKMLTDGSTENWGWGEEYVHKSNAARCSKKGKRQENGQRKREGKRQAPPQGTWQEDPQENRQRKRRGNRYRYFSLFLLAVAVLAVVLVVIAGVKIWMLFR